MRILCTLYLIFIFGCQNSESPSRTDFNTVFEQSEGMETATYEETITFYQQLADTYQSVAVYEMGFTDSGKRLHLVTFNPDRSFESEFSGKRDKNILLINNGIHPGESDGIDASMMLMRDLAQNKIPTPKNTIIAVIPIYNIGGALNRNSTTRTNQNGPRSYGFRGNARNFDLNRDFIKADTRNTRAFADLFTLVEPDLFIDNHVSNGADYQYVLTHLFTQHNKLGGDLGAYLHSEFIPKLEDSLAEKQWDITPYVNVFNRTPESGFSQFLDAPRYSTGYATLFNTLGMMVETHMLKPYKQRVEGTYELMKSFIGIADADAKKIASLRQERFDSLKPGKTYPIQWKVDTTQSSTLQFKGYEGQMETSRITGEQRLKYNRNTPFTRSVPYQDYFQPVKEVTIPSYYIIPQAYWDVIELLKVNDISMKRIQKDTLIQAEVYHIENFETVRNPYEGHYMHFNTEVRVSSEKVQVKEGDYIVKADQKGVRYLLETLEPEAPDSFFNWNYFDTILQQKEGFSPYVWEDKAEQFLQENPEIKKRFEEKKRNDAEFSNNWYAQLDWIHKQSPHYETSHLRYPVVRVGG